MDLLNAKSAYEKAHVKFDKKSKEASAANKKVRNLDKSLVNFKSLAQDAGDYVFCNYGNSMVVQAENSEQAKKIAMREGYNFQSAGGYIQVRGDNGTNTMQGVYLHEQEAAYGENHNVENKNSETAISKSKIATGDKKYTVESRDIGVGYSKNVVDNDNVSLDVAARVSMHTSIGHTDDHDYRDYQKRETAEAGFDLKVSPSDNISIGTTGNAGIMRDSIQTSYDEQKTDWSDPILKINAGVNANVKGETWEANAYGNVDYTNSFSGTFTTLDYEAGLDVTKEVGKDKSLIFGGKISSHTKDVRIGGFDERLKDDKTVTGELSYTSGNNTIGGALDIDVNNAKKSNATLSFKHKF